MFGASHDEVVGDVEKVLITRNKMHVLQQLLRSMLLLSERSRRRSEQLQLPWNLSKSLWQGVLGVAAGVKGGMYLGPTVSLPGWPLPDPVET